MSFLIASGHVEVEAKTDKALSAITGLVGALGAVGPVAGVAAAGLVGAGAGVAAFGIAAGKQVADIKKASEAQGKYQDAVAKSGKTSQEAAKAQLEYQRTLATMPRATREAAAAWSALTDEYKEWSDSLAGDTMPVFTHSFQLFQALLPKTTGLVKGTSAELDRFLTLVAGEVASPGFDRMMADFTEFSTGSLRFMLDGILDLSRAVAGFATDGGFDGFVDTAREAGPILGDLLANLAELAVNLTAAGGDLGISMLTVANALAEMANAIPPEALGVMLQMYAALKLVSLGIAAVSTVATSAAVARLGAYFALMRTAGVATTLSATAASMTRVQKASVGLGILAVAAIGIGKLAEEARGAPPDVDRLTTSLKNLAQTGQFSGELQKTFGDMDGLVAKVKELGKATQDQEDYVKSFANSGIGPLDSLRREFHGLVDDFKDGGDSFNALKEDFSGLDQAMAGMVSSGYGKQAAEDFDIMKTALQGAGYSTEEINALLPKYQDAVASLKAEQALAAQGMGLFGQQAIDTKAKLDEQKASADGLRQSIQALNDINRAALGGMIGFEASIDAAAKAAKENAGSLRMVNGELDVNSPKAQAAATALADLGAKTDAATAAAREGGASWEKVNGIYSRGRGELVKYAQQMGLSKSEAEAFADSILQIPDKKSMQVDMRAEDATRDLEAFNAAVKKTPGAKSVTLSTLSKAAEDILEGFGLKVKRLPDGSVTVSAKTGTALSGVKSVSAAVAALHDKSITIFTKKTTRYITEYQTKYLTGQSQHDIVGATGGRFTGRAFTGYAGGGRVDGPGTGTSDDVFAPWLSAGEWVMKAAAVDQYGEKFMAAVNSGSLEMPRMASGGKVPKAQQDARAGLAKDFGISYFGRMAGYQRDPFEKGLGVPGSVGDLVSNLNDTRVQIKAASSGKTESSLLKKLDSSGKALIDNQRKLEAVNKSLDGAKNNLEDLKGKFDSLKTSVSSSLVSFGNITKAGKYGTSAETLIKQLSSDAGRTTEFAKQLEQLKGKGLNAQSISEIAAAGVTGGGMATAQSLLNATPEQIKEINALEAQLKASADKAGSVTADAMYGAGIKAAEGLVKGLTAQQDKIEATMMTIAQGMEKAIKKALGIKSPSKVMEPIGDFAMQGVEQGWAKRMARGNTLISGSTAGLRAKPAVIGAGTAPAASAASTVHVTATFNTMTLPGPTERRTFVRGLVKDINDELLDYQKGRRR